MFGLTPINRRGDLSKFEDFSEFSPMVDFYNMIDGFFNDSISPFKSQMSTFKLDLRENEKEFIVDAELPGFAKEDIKLDLDNDRLIISASNQQQTEEEKENYIHKERRQCSMQRSVYLNNVNKESITAKFENGILNIVLPKKEPSQSKTQIQID